jgi:Polysaccharide biosynthesis protein
LNTSISQTGTLLVSSSKNRILQLISETVPVGTAEPVDLVTITNLTKLTNELIDAYEPEALRTDPFAEVYKRQVSIDHAEIGHLLKGKVVLVTGGSGFVGSNLIAKLRLFGVQKIVSVDVAEASGARIAVNTVGSDSSIPLEYHLCDVRDRLSLARVFAVERPQVVFHLAAQRLPGLAETQVNCTTSTNVLGCQNVIGLCETYRVETCIFSSTGKASRYFTPDIYAGSKKIAEWLFSDHSSYKHCQYGIVRFTHVVENSPISAELDQRVAQGLVSMHAPNRHIYAQNIEESVSLLLKTLTIVEAGQTNLLAVRDLGWPVNTLEVALHKILMSGRHIPLYFKGLPPGYEQHVFMGQLDLSGHQEVLPMLNVLELAGSKVCATTNTVTTTIAPFDSLALEQALEQIKSAVSDQEIRQAVIGGIKSIALSTFVLADRQCLLNILRWGTSEQELAASGVTIDYHKDTIDLLNKAIGINSNIITTAAATRTHIGQRIRNTAEEQSRVRLGDPLVNTVCLPNLA